MTDSGLTGILNAKSIVPGSSVMQWLNRFLFKDKRRPGQSWPSKESKDDLVVEDSAFLRVSSNSYRSLLRTVVSEAELIAAGIKDKARGEAEAEAARIVLQARLDGQEIKGKAEIVAQEEARNIVSAAEKEAAGIELEAREKAFQFLVQTSQAVEKEVREEYRLALSRLSAHLEYLTSESQKTDAELRNKLARLVADKPWALEEHETTLLGTSEISASSSEISTSPATKTKSDSISEENVTRVVDEHFPEKVKPETHVELSGPSAAPLESWSGALKPDSFVAEKVPEVVPPLPVERADSGLEKIAGDEKKGRRFSGIGLRVPWRRPSPPVMTEKEAVVEKTGSSKTVSEATLAEQLAEKKSPVSSLAEVAISEPVIVAEEKGSQKVAGKHEEVVVQEAPTLLEINSQALYSGEVELTIVPPVDLKLVSQLYNYLQTVPELKVLYTRGSWEQGTTIVVVLEKPFSLIKTIAGVPGMVVTAGLIEKDGKAKGKANLLLRRGDKDKKKLGLILKEAAG